MILTVEMQNEREIRMLMSYGNMKGSDQPVRLYCVITAIELGNQQFEIFQATTGKKLL